METRTREELEADMASDTLQNELASAIEKINRSLLIVQIAAEETPEEIRAGLLMLQGKHPKVYPAKPATGKTPEEGQPEEPAEA